MSDKGRILVGEFVSICPRGKRGRWSAEFHRDGQHHRRALNTTNLRVARQRAAVIDRELAAGTFQAPVRSDHKQPQSLLTQVIDDFIVHCDTGGSRDKTRTKYAGILSTFAEYCASQDVTLMRQIDLQLIDRYRAHRKPKLSDGSMHHEGRLLKQFLGWATTRRHLAANPLADVLFPKPRRQQRPAPSLKEIDSILAVTPERLRAVLTVLAFAGLRSGEVRNLLVEDVDLANNWINVMSRPGAETKTGQSWKVPIHDRLRQVLEGLPRRSSGYFFVAGPSRKYPRGDHHISTDRLNESFRAIVESVGMTAGRDAGLTIHTMRHFFRTFATNAGVPERMIYKWLGHAPDRSMGNTYYNPSDEDFQKAMKKVPFGTGMPTADGGETEVSHV